MLRKMKNSKYKYLRNIAKPKVQKSENIRKYKSKVKKIIYQNNQLQIQNVNRVTKKNKRKQYSDKALEQAITAVNNGCSYRKAGESLVVPSATLFRKIKSNSLKIRPGPKTVLTEAEEDDIEQWIIYRAETGSPVTKEELFKSVQCYLDRLEKKRVNVFKNNLPGKKWYESFKKRHPNIALRTPQNLPLCRAAVTEDMLRSWFTEVEEYLVKKNLKDIDASRVFNCDETNFAFCPKPQKVLTKKGAKSVYKVNATAERENITTIFMYNAKGARVKPMTLFKYEESIPKRIVEKAPCDWSLGISDSGWMTTESFYEYITNIFYPYLIENEIEVPVLLYLDGHASHVTLPLVSFCKGKKIEIICLYPHPTHITQPLDIAFFHPLKDVYSKKAIPKWMNDNRTNKILREDFTCVLRLAVELFDNEKSAVIHGFERAGLWPFNPDAVDYNVLKKSKKKTERNDSHDSTCTSNSNAEIRPVENHTSVNNSKHFSEQFEEKLPIELLEQFRFCKTSQKWTGFIKYEGLFEFWLSLNKSNNAFQVDLNTYDLNSINEQLKLTNNNLVLTLEPPRDHQQSQELALQRSEKSIELDMNQVEFKEILPETSEPSTSNFDQDHEKNMSVLRDILSGNVHISPIKEPDVNDPLPSVIVQPENLLYASECSTSEIQSLLGQNMTESTNGLQIIEVASLFTADESLAINNLVGNENGHMSSGDNHVDENFNNNVPIIQSESKDSEMKPENTSINESSTDSNFNCVFTLPTHYLPKKKRMKLEKSGKKKSPVVGTSDEWFQLQKEKEKKLKEKEERLARKKELQEKKKALAEQSKKLQEEINSLSKSIKQEK